MRVRTLMLVLAASLTLAACGETTGTRTVSGGLIGAGSGAAIGAIAGNAGLGAVIGAGVGLAGGYLYDQQKKGNLN